MRMLLATTNFSAE